MFALLALLTPLALADTLTLDSGATVRGALVAYNPAGECRVEVAEGELAGSTLLLPCGRIHSFERDVADFTPIATSEVEEEDLDRPAPVLVAEPAPEPVAEPQPAALPVAEPAPEPEPIMAASSEPAPELAPEPALVDGPAYEPPPALPPERILERVPSPPRAPTVRAPASASTW